MKLQHILIFIPFLWACNDKFAKNEQPVAKVFDKYLLKSEVSGFIPQGTPSKDSLIMAQSYVRNWITKELLLHKDPEPERRGKKHSETSGRLFLFYLDP